MTGRAEEIALLMATENGKALADAWGEWAYAAEFFWWYSEEAVRLIGSVQTAPSGANRILVLHQPVGVSVLITPWNFPAGLATRKIGPVFAAGGSELGGAARAGQVVEHLGLRGTQGSSMNPRVPVGDGAYGLPRCRRVAHSGDLDRGQPTACYPSYRVVDRGMTTGDDNTDVNRIVHFGQSGVRADERADEVGVPGCLVSAVGRHRFGHGRVAGRNNAASSKKPANKACVMPALVLTRSRRTRDLRRRGRPRRVPAAGRCRP